MSAIEKQRSLLSDVLREMIDQDYWFFIAKEKKIVPNSRSVQIALERIF